MICSVIHMYIPRIDHDRCHAIIVFRFPGQKLCARITVKPLAEHLRAITAPRSR